jgi:hypothetical protein
MGTTVDAVRSRVRRGTLESERDEDGRVYVWLGDDQSSDESKLTVEGSALVEELREQVRYLREQLDQEREARTEERRRHDTLLAQLMQRIPEIEAPQEPSETRPPSAGLGPSAREGPRPATATESPQEGAEPRSWWRRLFGGEA